MRSRVAEAFDSLAQTYDQKLEPDRWMRNELWGRYLTLFCVGDHVLDVGCGTGEDSLFLARNGIRVTALDISEAMIQRLRSKMRQAGLDNLIETRVQDCAVLHAMPVAHFDGIISAFAALNTIPDLPMFAAQAGRLLRPQGRAIFHLLNRFSLWEWLGLLGRGQISSARQVGKSLERTFSIGGYPIRHRLWTPYEAYHTAFSKCFHLRRVYGLGALRPPQLPYQLPGTMVAALGSLEGKVRGHRPFLNWGRFFVLELEKRQQPAHP